MTHNQFIALVRQPEKVADEHIADLKELVDMYPYFGAARMLYTKALKNSDSIHYASSLQTAVLYAPSSKWLYYFIHPEVKITSEPFRRERQSKSSGDYFDMINLLEKDGGDAKQSLKGLAEKLKSARSMVVQPTKASLMEDSVAQAPPKPQEVSSTIGLIDYFALPGSDVTEEMAKKLIVEKKYVQAIAILRELNLNNPKKSVYFADQIRFLEKVLDNLKK